MSTNWINMRRQDRAKDDTWIKPFITAAPAGQLAVVHESRPYIITNTYAYVPDRHCLYIHTARHGFLRTIAETETHSACFTVAEIGRFLPADTMKELSVEFSSAVLFGNLSVVESQKECRQGLEMLAAKYFPHLEVDKDIRALTPTEVKETTVYRFDIEHWTGKAKHEQDDFPGAFHWDDRPIK